MIDVRSDTVSQPTEHMRRAIVEAELGDDGYREDPTVTRLEETCARLLGKASGLFVASGTMGNLVSLMAGTARGSTVAADSRSHLLIAEHSGLERVASMVGIPVEMIGHRGDTEALDLALSSNRASVVAIENTRVLHAGDCVDESYMVAVADVARDHGAWVHLDGARLFNAAVALGVPLEDLSRSADSVTVCLSKGLCCPAGAIVCGSTEFVERAREARRMLGGGMRQAGVLAAAGLVSLDERLDETWKNLELDHRMATLLARQLSRRRGIEVVAPLGTPTNMVVFKLIREDGTASEDLRDAFISGCAQRGVRLSLYPEGMVRAVTYTDIRRVEIATVLRTIDSVLETMEYSGA